MCPRWGWPWKSRSGRVALKRSEECGEHSTGAHEEVLVILEGSGHVETEGCEPLPVREGQAVYVPPQTTHNVRNTEAPLLRYVYIITPVASP